MAAVARIWRPPCKHLPRLVVWMTGVPAPMSASRSSSRSRLSVTIAKAPASTAFWQNCRPSDFVPAMAKNRWPLRICADPHSTGDGKFAGGCWQRCLGQALWQQSESRRVFSLSICKSTRSFWRISGDFSSTGRMPSNGAACSTMRFTAGAATQPPVA